MNIGVHRLVIRCFTRSSFDICLPKAVLSIYSKPSLFNSFSSLTRTRHCHLYQNCRFVNFATMPSAEKVFCRLPKNVIPEHYDITLQPDLVKFDILGDVCIKVKVAESTREVILNASELELSSVSFVTEEGKEIKDSAVQLNKEAETATLAFESPLPTGKGELKIKFKGELNDKMEGFYRSQYTNPEGEVHYAAVTQFEATSARKAFPCWDEPALKATFDITLIVPKDRVALSNTNVISSTPYSPESEDANAAGDSGLQCVKFATTPIMSTYLVACIVGEFDYVEGLSDDGVKVRVYTPVGKKEQGQFALDVSVKVLPFYKEYFNIAYPLPKLDLIAIQNFSSGAMENWGLVTYRETCLLVDPQNTSARNKQWVAIVVGHELAHQWFGNLVTMEWWTHLWLNEGFASWIEYLCVDMLFPHYNIWTQFVTDTFIPALELDALRNSHPIEVPVGHPSEVDEIFDNISYNKGASVIRMLHSFIGDKDFRKGMNHYLTKFQYSNTFTEDLWASLEHASGKPIGEIMSTWTRQMGFPLIKVSTRQEGSSRILTFVQEKFCADPNDLNGDNSQWMVPISISTATDPSIVIEKFLLDSKSAEVTLEHVRPDEWVKLNPNTVGYYRVQYPPEMLEQFLLAIQDQSLPPLDRLGLLDDLFALVLASQAPTVELLKLLQAFVKETDYTVWSSVSNCMLKLNALLSHTEHLPRFHEFGRRLFNPVIESIGWDPVDGESHLDVLLRSLVIVLLGTFKCDVTIAEAKKRLDAHVNGSCILPADLRSSVYRCAINAGDEETLETMLKLYRETDLNEEKDRILRSLGTLPDKSLLQKVLDFTMSDDVRTQDKVFGVIAVGLNRTGRAIAWEFFKRNIDTFLSMYAGGGHLITYLVKNLTENFASEELASEVQAFFAEHPVPSAERTAQQSVENILLNAGWLKRDAESVGSWLNAQ